MSDTTERVTRNATELAGERAAATFQRDEYGTAYDRVEGQARLDTLDWLEGLTSWGPASGKRRDGTRVGMVRRELLSAMTWETRLPVRERARPAGIIRCLKWYLLDPTAAL